MKREREQKAEDNENLKPKSYRKPWTLWRPVLPERERGPVASSPVEFIGRFTDPAGFLLPRSLCVEQILRIRSLFQVNSIC